MWFLVDTISGQPYYGQKERPYDVDTLVEYEFGLLCWVEDNSTTQKEKDDDSQ